MADTTASLRQTQCEASLPGGAPSQASAERPPRCGQEDGDAERAEIADRLRTALRGLASTVVVVSSEALGERYAMAATSFTPVSMDPPSVLVCINRSASMFRPIMAGAGFCVNLLAPRHEALARACSGGDRARRFEIGDFVSHAGGAPYLRDAQAVIQCAQDGRYLYGTHAIIIGRVRSVHAAPCIDPLIYVSGRYAGLGQAGGDRPVPEGGGGPG
jgi:flavin reductase (DIM6/NTAB) family NADH-FMN oxidoreductase RutF